MTPGELPGMLLQNEVLLREFIRATQEADPDRAAHYRAFGSARGRQLTPVPPARQAYGTGAAAMIGFVRRGVAGLLGLFALRQAEPIPCCEAVI
jgi:hypothetical protein